MCGWVTWRSLVPPVRGGSLATPVRGVVMMETVQCKRLSCDRPGCEAALQPGALGEWTAPPALLHSVAARRLQWLSSSIGNRLRWEGGGRRDALSDPQRT